MFLLVVAIGGDFTLKQCLIENHVDTLKKQIAILERAQEASDDKIPFTIEIVKISFSLERVCERYSRCSSR